MVLKSPEVPAVLVEMGFLSHPEDEAALRRPAHRKKLAAALSRAVLAWLARQGRPVVMGGAPLAAAGDSG